MSNKAETRDGSRPGVIRGVRQHPYGELSFRLRLYAAGPPVVAQYLTLIDAVVQDAFRCRRLSDWRGKQPRVGWQHESRA